MKHTVRLHGVVVGHSDLEHTERDVGRAWGRLRPALGYALVQPVFRMFAEAVPRDGSARDMAALERYYKARDALDLELLDARGGRIPTSTIHIVDYTVEEGSDALELEVLIADERYWETRPA